MDKLPQNLDINNLINDLKNISWEAADVLIYYSNKLLDSNYKKKIIKNPNSKDPVTLADLKVNELLIKRINEKYRETEWQILTEENTKFSSHNLEMNTDFVWVIDPLDGTKDFIEGTGNYAMHLALNYKKKSYIGFVLIPEKDELWITNGIRTWGEKRDGSLIEQNFSKRRQLNDMTVVTSKNHRNYDLESLLEKICFKNRETMGSIGCKIASIIRGETDIYISLSLPGKTHPKDWDFAAPEAILKAAGGAITNLENEILEYGKQNYEQRGVIVASNNKENHGRLCREIKQIIYKNNICTSST